MGVSMNDYEVPDYRADMTSEEYRLFLRAICNRNMAQIKGIIPSDPPMKRPKVVSDPFLNPFKLMST